MNASIPHDILLAQLYSNPSTMQQAQSLMETNTAPRAVPGQFEDADHEGGEVIVSRQNSTKSLSDNLKSTSTDPPALKRRLSSNTTEATKALLAFAAAAGTAPPKKKKKTFVVRLEEIKEYNARHGRVPRRGPVPSDEAWEQNLLAWVQDCRKQFAEGSFGPEKAKALHELGIEGFQPAAEANTAHPALQALMLKRQQQEARLMELRRASTGMTSRRSRCDPDGATTAEDVYSSSANSERELQELQLQEVAMQSQRLALEEMHARENIMAREALLREQLFREQRLAQAMATQRRLSMGAFPPQGLLPQPGRIMTLLQPMESVPSRDPTMMASFADPRMNALLHAQLMQRQATMQAAQHQQLRRPSDASSNFGGHVERRPSEIGSGPVPHVDMADVRSTWDQRIQDMFQFFQAHGHVDVPAHGEHQELGQWLATTRGLLRDGLLPAAMAKEFLEMTAWTVDPPPKDGPSKKKELVTPPTRSKVKTIPRNSPSPKLGKNKRALPKSWHQSFTELEAFKKKFGHCDVKMIVNSPYALLGKWLASQRSRHKLGQLPVDKVTRLREVGASGFEKGGKLPMRSMFADADEAEFDRAVRRLRDMENGSGSEEEELPTELSSPTREKRVRHSYETRVEHIKAFKEKHGHVKIRLGSNDKHEELLARWLASARSRYRGGQFKEERAAELRALGCDGFDGAGEGSFTAEMEEEAEFTSRKRDSPARTATPSPPPPMEDDETSEPPSKKQRGAGRRQTFDDMLKELEAYQYIYGVGCSVPKPDGDKGKLGRWLAFQRRQFIAGKLSDERIEKLKTIGRKEFNKSALIVRAAERAAAGIHLEQQ